MTALDYGLFAKTLMADGQDAEAINVLEAYRDSLPYEVGTGLAESLCYENLGRYDESVLAAYVDVNYQESRGILAPAKVLENVKTLEATIKSRGLAPEKSGLTTLKAVESWVVGDWKKVDFDDRLLAVSPDARFLKLGSLLQGGRVGDEDLKAYSDLERRFRDFPSYYLPLLHYLKEDRKEVRSAGFAVLAEKVVNLAPQGPWGDDGRRALALGYGLPVETSPALLTRAEVDQAIGQADIGKSSNSGEFLTILRPNTPSRGCARWLKTRRSGRFCRLRRPGHPAGPRRG